MWAPISSAIMPGAASRSRARPRLAFVLPGQQLQAKPEGVVGDGFEVQRALEPGQDPARPSGGAWRRCAGLDPFQRFAVELEADIECAHDTLLQQTPPRAQAESRNFMNPYETVAVGLVRYWSVPAWFFYPSPPGPLSHKGCA